ncbi:DUF4202 domain-containing protein [Tunicatimonas pelagia]|uniref:DUF4202 domain-containing protein n=1 Tax=Tunicatimonas pelagia TaxID=931531 RepID=UPI002666A94E|nr:DUF4202 domain-containing protein [Tunicatimonas pelagia]WKN45239.1 DUF4202 domain-containing protein [Tunicatimonas pelagia]
MAHDSSIHRLPRTLAAFDQANRQDPRTDYDEAGRVVPSELLYAQRMSETLHAFYPDAPETLQLAARSQHIERWKIPRNQYPMDRKGYLLWRSQLKKFHSNRAAEIMQEQGYEQEAVARVVSLISKKQLKRDAEVQVLEDVICLVFLQYYFAAFAKKHTDEKVIDIVAKTWRKMSGQGQQAALSLPFSSGSLEIIKKAIG